MQAMAHIHNSPRHRVLTRSFCERNHRQANRRTCQGLLCWKRPNPVGLPKDLRGSVACLTPAFPAVGKARRSAVMTNLTLNYAMLSYSVGVWREGRDGSGTV